MKKGLFPVYAGVIPRRTVYNHHEKAFPRVCGGDPFGFGDDTITPGFSPCMRG